MATQTQTLGDDDFGANADDTVEHYRLVSLNGECKHQDISAEGSVVLGRSTTSNDVVIGHKAVSSKHAEYKCYKVDETNEVVLEIVDHSVNGVFVNGTRVGRGNKAILRAGDIVSFLTAWTPALAVRDKIYAVVVHDMRVEPRADILPVSGKRAAADQGVQGTPLKKPKIQADDDDKSTASEAADAIEEALCCGICRDVFYKDCPVCRVQVVEVRRNHQLQGVVDTFLNQHPAKRRSDEEIKALDEKNKISTESLRVFSRRRHDDYSDEESEESEETCRHCLAPAPDGYQCTADSIHITCSACYELIPERNDKRAVQRCGLCHSPYCDQYYSEGAGQGCIVPRGRGALKPMEDYNHTALPLAPTNMNMHEKQILVDYLVAKNISPSDVYKECLEKVKSGEWQCPAYPRLLDPGYSACTLCSTNFFKSMLYTYRASIPNDDFPEAVTRRGNCWWGKNCRTQHHNVGHSQKLNHICEQSRR